MKTFLALAVALIGGIVGTIMFLQVKEPPQRPTTPGGDRNIDPVLTDKKGVRVLFVGNSYTFSNDLPRLVQKLAEAAGEELPLMPVMAAPGGVGLKQHCESGDVETKIAEIPFNYVVLQDKSAMPLMSPAEREQDVLPYAKQLVAKATGRGARAVFFMTWAYRDGGPGTPRAETPGESYFAMQAQSRQAYQSLADNTKAMLAPVGVAWERAVKARPNVELWSADGSHPSTQGSYLAACVFYSIFYEKSPVGNSFTAGLDADTARFLQGIAAEATLKK